MKHFSKRLSIVALSALTIAWSLGASMLQVPVAHAVAPGSLIKASTAAVYYLASDGKRYTFPNDKIYHSWYSDFSGVQVISDSELASYQIGGNVRYRAGTRLVKITTDPSVYAVTPAGTLRKIPSEAVAAAIYGSNWAQWVDDLPDAFFAPPSYTIASPLSGATDLPSGLLVSDAAGNKYMISGTTKRPIASQSAMDANHLWSMYVRPVADATLATFSNGASISGADTALMDASQGGGGGVIINTGSGVTVSLASDTPVANTLPDGTIYNPLLKFNVTASNDGDAQLTSVTITRGGFIANTNVTGVSVWDQSGMRHGSILTSLTSTGMGTIGFSGSPIVIPAGQTRSVTVAANIDAAANSATINFSLAGATALTFVNSPAVNGSFPVMGNTMSVVDGSSSVGSVTVAGQSTVGISTEPSSATTGNLEVGQAQMEVGKYNFSETSSREDVRIRQLTFYVEGDINENTDVANFTVYGPDGVALGSAAHSMNRYATVTLTNPYVIPQGTNRNLTVKVDATGGANRWFRLQLQNNYDILMSGVTTGANLQATSAAFNGGSSWSAVSSSSGYFKIKQGALTITKNPASPSGNLTAGSSNIELARFDLTANGENMELQKFALSNANYYDFTGNFSIVDASNGTVYYTGTANATSTYNTTAISSASNQVSFSNYITLNAGQVKTIKLMGNLSSSAHSGNAILASIGNFYAHRLSSLDYVNVATGGAAANSLTIGGSSTFTVSKHTTPSDPNTIAPGTANALIATFAIGNQSSGSEDVRVNSISVNVALTTALVNSVITNLKLYDMTGATPVQLGNTLSSVAANANAFTVNWTVPANSTRILGVKGDLSSAITNGDTLMASFTANAISGTGQTSNNTVQGPSAAVNGQLNSMAAAAVRVYFEQEPATVSKIVLAGSQGVELGKFRFQVTNEDVTLNKITFRVSTTGATTGTYSQASGSVMFGNFYLYNAATNQLIGSSSVYQRDQGISSTLPGVNGLAASSTADVIFTLTSPVSLPRDVGGLVSLRADIANQGSGVTSTIASVLLRSNSNSDIEVRSASQGLLAATAVQTTSTSGVSATTNNYLYIDAAPVIVTLPVTGYHVKGTTDEIGRFEVRNYGQVPILLNSLGFSVTAGGLASSSAVGTAVDTIRNVMLYDDNGTFIATSTSYFVLCGGINVNTNPQCSAANSSGQTAYRVEGSQNTGFEANRNINAAAGGNYGSRVFSIRADTSNITAAGGSNTRTVTVQVTGTRGFAQASGDNLGTVNASSTRYWATGGIQYKMQPSGYGYSLDQDVSDSYPVTAAQLNYN